MNDGSLVSAARRLWTLAWVCALLALDVTARASPSGPAELRLLGHDNRPLRPAEHVLGISRRITHDRDLPRTWDADAVSPDPENFRLELSDPGETRDVVYAQIEALGGDGVRSGLLRHVPLRRVPGRARFRSPFLRLVADATDASAPGVAGQLLSAQLRDRVKASIRRAGTWVTSGEFSVGAQGGSGPRTVLRGALRISVLRAEPGGQPVVGDTSAEALVLARRQVEIANEIWAQCFIEFGEPDEAWVRVVDPPPPALLAIADVDGLPARGGGQIRFRANGVSVGPLSTLPGALPEETASRIARAAERSGFQAEISVNPRAEQGAFPSADVILRDANGAYATLSAQPDHPLSSDAQQRLAIGHVDLSDGIEEFDNAVAAAGTLEERTLVKLLADDDPGTIDLLLVSRFVHPQRQGEAFIESDGSSMANVLIFGRDAVRFERQAWVQAHELGHVLLDEAFHPDNFGVDRPWLLMDADARQGRTTGPKRLREDDCAKVRRRSGPQAHPPLLRAVGAR